MDVKVPLSQLSLVSVLETCHDSGVSSEYGTSRLELGEQRGQEGHGAPGQDSEQPQYLDLEADLHGQSNTSVHAQYGPYSSNFASSQGQVSDNGLDYQSGAGYGSLGSFANMDMEAAGLTPFRGYGSYSNAFNYVISPMQQQQEQQQHQSSNYYFGDQGLPALTHGDGGLDGSKGFYHSQGNYGADGGPHFAAMEHFGSPTSWSGTPGGPNAFHGGPTHYAAASSQLLYGDQHCHFNRNWNALGGEGAGAGPGPRGSGEGAYGALGTPQGSASTKEGAGKRRSQGSTSAACPQPSASGSRLGRPRGTQRRGMKRTPSNSEEGSGGAPEPPATPLSPSSKATISTETDREALMNIQTLKPRDIVSWYIDHLINENEAITEMSQSFTIPMNLFETDETYFIDSLAKKMTFPTRKFLNWMSTELPSLNPHAIDFTEGKQGTVTPPDWNPEGKTKAEIVQQTFYSFQERRNRIREQKRNSREHC